jgi:hypothetical protein
LAHTVERAGPGGHGTRGGGGGTGAGRMRWRQWLSGGVDRGTGWRAWAACGEHGPAREKRNGSGLENSGIFDLFK